MMVEKQNSRTATVEAHPDSSGKKATVEWGQRFNFDFTQENAEFQLTVWGRGNNKVASQTLGPTLKVKVADLPPGQSVKQEFKLSDKCTLTLKFNLTPIVKRKITENDFERVKIIGRGSFGTVLLVKKQETGCLYAMKVLHKKNIIERNAVRHAIAERTVLKNINHPFLVHLKYAFQNPEHLFMVIDYLNGGEMFFHLQQEDAFSEQRAKFYAAEIVLALGYLHDNGIMYRDLKPENILLDMEGHICIVDFGLCKTGLGINSKTGTFCGSLEYMAPEVLEGKEYAKDIDWWALATMVYEMVEGIPPFWDEDQDLMLENIAQCDIADLLKNNNKFSKECKDFILSILHIDPSKRLGHGENGTQDIKNHPWFADIDWIKLYNKLVEPSFKPHLENESDTRYFDEEVTAEDPHIHNFDTNATTNGHNVSSIHLEDDPFDDFSFEEPFPKTPIKTPNRRMRAGKNNRNSPIKFTIGRSNSGRPTPIKSPPEVPEKDPEVPELNLSTTPRKDSKTRKESKTPRKDSKTPRKNSKSHKDSNSEPVPLSQNKSEKSPRKFLQTSLTKSFSKENSPNNTPPKKNPMLKSRSDIQISLAPPPPISITNEECKSNSSRNRKLSQPEPYIVSLTGSMDSVLKSGRKYSHGIKPVSLAPSIRQMRSKSGSSLPNIISPRSGTNSAKNSPRNASSVDSGRKSREEIDAREEVDPNDPDKQNCVVS